MTRSPSPPPELLQQAREENDSQDTVFVDVETVSTQQLDAEDAATPTPEQIHLAKMSLLESSEEEEEEEEEGNVAVAVRISESRIPSAMDPNGQLREATDRAGLWRYITTINGSTTVQWAEFHGAIEPRHLHD